MLCTSPRGLRPETACAHAPGPPVPAPRQRGEVPHAVSSARLSRFRLSGDHRVRWLAWFGQDDGLATRGERNRVAGGQGPFSIIATRGKPAPLERCARVFRVESLGCRRSRPSRLLPPEISRRAIVFRDPSVGDRSPAWEEQGSEIGDSDPQIVQRTCRCVHHHPCIRDACARARPRYIWANSFALY